MLQVALIGQLLKYGLLVGGGIFLWRFFGKKRDTGRQQKEDKTFTEDQANSQAVRIYNTLNRVGFQSLFLLDATDTQALINIGKEITNFQAVVDSYNARYGRSLNEDLKKLQPSVLNAFYAMARVSTDSSVNYAVERDGVPKLDWVLTNNETNIRSTPNKTSLFEISNIIKTVPHSRLIGLTTGNAKTDVGKDVIFVEVETVFEKHKRKVWVAKSQVEFINPKQMDVRRKRGEKFMHAQLSGIEQEQPQIATRKATYILDDQLKPITHMRDRVLLGFPLGCVNTLKGLFVCFLAPDGNRYWCKAKDVFLVLPKHLKEQLAIN